MSDPSPSENQPNEQGQKAEVPPVAPTLFDLQASLSGMLKDLDPRRLTTTLLDSEACRQVLSSIVSKKEARLKEQGEGSAPCPKPLQPIENYRQASPCGVTWEQMSGGSEFRVCEHCKLHVYNFEKMEMSEVENLVFTREGRPPTQFYRRSDGRFLTNDCPVGVQARQRLILIIALAVLLLGTLVLASLMVTSTSVQTTAEPPASPVGNQAASQASNKVNTSSSSNEQRAASMKIEVKLAPKKSVSPQPIQNH